MSQSPISLEESGNIAQSVNRQRDTVIRRANNGVMILYLGLFLVNESRKAWETGFTAHVSTNGGKDSTFYGCCRCCKVVVKGSLTLLEACLALVIVFDIIISFFFAIGFRGKCTIPDLLLSFSGCCCQSPPFLPFDDRWKRTGRRMFTKENKNLR